MSERRAAAKGRRLGSSRRRQGREGFGEPPAAAPGPREEPPRASEVVQRVQDLLRERGTDQEGFVSRSDVQKLQEEGFPCSREELELVFDGLDAAGSGRLGTEEFSAGLRQFLSSQKAAREHRRRKTASRRVRLVLPIPALDGVDSEERRHFAAFMEQLGTDNVSEEQEIWQLWVKLRQDEPQLLDNLEGFLAKMRHRIQEARNKKEALELTLNKRLAEHDKEVQQLCEVLEQQIQQEQRRLQQQSVARSRQHSTELQQVLDAIEREVQRLVTAQMELERRCRSLLSSQQVTSKENQRLQQSNRALEDHLQHLHQQLQQTQGRLRTMRVTVAWEHTEEPGDRAVAELPSEMPMSPQLSPGKSEKFRSEMRIRLGSQSGESKAKGTHQVVWEVLPAERTLSGAPQRASSVEEDPFPQTLKEERFSDQSSLLREMNDAIAALSKHLKAQAPAAAPTLADTPCHPQDDAEPQTGPEAATAHGTTPDVLQETLPGHVHHELFEGDLKEGPATAELRALDGTQAGASTGARHHMAQEPGAEQGESLEEAQRRLFLQGKDAGVEEMLLNVAEHLGESTEAGQQAVTEVEGAGWMQERTGWEKPQLLGEAEEVEISPGENLEAGLGPPEAGQEGVAVGLQPAGIARECVQALDVALQERADPSPGLPEKLETKLGEHLEPEPPSWGEAQVGAAHGDGVSEVAVAPGPGVQEGDPGVQPQGETTDTEVLEVLPARAGSSRGEGEEEEVEEAEDREAERQLQGEAARGGTGSLSHGQEGAGGADVELLEALGSDTDRELLAELGMDLQVWREAGAPGTEQGGGVDPGVQLEEDKAGLGLGEQMGAAARHSEGPSPAAAPVGSPHLCGLFPVKSQALELVEGDLQLCGGLSPETPRGGEGGRAIQLEEDEENGAQEQGEYGLPQEPGPHPSGVTLGQGEAAGAGPQPGEGAESLDTTEDQSTDASVLLIAEGGELTLTLGGSTEADLQLLGEAGSPGTEQGESVDSDVQPLDEGDKAELVEVEAEDAQAEMQLLGGRSPGVLWGGEGGTDVQNKEEEDGAQGQGDCDMPHEPVLDAQGAAVRQGEGAGEGMQAQEEAESLDMLGDQSTDASVLLIAEVSELQLTPAGSREADLQLMGEAGSPGTGQEGSLAPDVHPLDRVDKAELVEVEAEDLQAEMQLCGGASPETPQGGEGGRAIQLRRGEEDQAQEQGEHGRPQGPGPHHSGVTLRQGEVAGAGPQPGEGAESLDTTEDQSSGASVLLIAEGGELTLTLGGSREADLQLLGEAGSPGTAQRGSLAPDVHPLDEVDKEAFLEMEAEDAQEDAMLHGGVSPGDPWGGEGGTDVQFEEEEEDVAQGQGECELPQRDSWRHTQLCGGASQKPPQGEGDPAAMQPRDEAEDGGQGQAGLGLLQELVPHLSGVSIRQRRGPGAGVQALEEVVVLDTGEDQSTGANMQLIAEGCELTLTLGGSREADLQLLGEAGSPGREQGRSMDSDVQPLDEVDKEAFLEMEAEDAQEDTMLHGGVSPGDSWGGEGGTDVQFEEEEEDGAQGQGECKLPHEPVLDAQGAAVRQGEGAGEGMQEETESLDTTEDQSTDANVLLIAERDELTLTLGGSREADLQLLGEAGSPGTEQGRSMDSDVQALDEGDKAELLEVEAEDAQAEMMLCGGLSQGGPWGGEEERAVHLEEDEEDGALYPEPVTAAEGPGLGAKLGACTGPEGQVLEDTQALELLQGERAAAEGKPLDGAPGLEVAQGGSLEAGARNAVKTQGLGLNQGHGDAVTASASPVSEVPFQISTLKLEMMMQEDVLIPDVWQLMCAPGQAAQRELQEQVSAQGHEGRPHTAAQQPERKPLHVMEPEQAAAGPAEPPKQEVPPASTLNMMVPPEDAGNDQLGMVLRDNSLGQRQLLGEQSKDLSVGQQEKNKECGQKMSQEGKPSPEEPGAVTAGGTGAAPGDYPKASLDPEHLYNVLFIGDSNVGKTSFLYRLHADTFNPHLTATVGLDYQIKNLVVDNKRFALRLWDSAGQERYHSMTKQFFRRADGLVLMYDLTSARSFSAVRYWLSCIQEAAEDGVAILLLGNKTDCAAQRQVPTKEGECLAKEHQLMFYECSAASGHNVFESMVSFIRLLKVREDEFKNKTAEVPMAPQKKKGCCW